MRGMPGVSSPAPWPVVPATRCVMPATVVYKLCTVLAFAVSRGAMDLFAQSAKKRHVGQPLAERMRPRSLGELVGQAHLVGPGRILSNLAPGRAIPSLLLWG